MAIIAYKTKGLQGDQIATALAVGFSRQIKNWWENFFSPEARSEILNHGYTHIND